MIEFLCPNGHRIRCQAAQAGRAAKCPRCGVKFRIPEASELDSPHTNGTDSGILGPEFTDSGVGGQRALNSAKVAAKQPGISPQFEFLCPNGHRLHGAASLQGRPGQCPDCGSRFRIPTYEDIPAEEDTEEEIHLGRVDGREGSEIHAAGAASAQPRLHDVHERPSSAAESRAALFARLWEIRAKDAAVELRLRSGETITPDRFLAKASRESGQGVFAIVEPDATVTVAIIAWDAVERMTVRGLKEVPKELGE